MSHSQNRLVDVNRGGRVENVHQAWLVVCDADNRSLYSTPGGDSAATYFRSAAKPFQAIPLVASGLSGGLSAEELAVTCASHTASAYHTRVVNAILQKAGLSPDDLLCGPHEPLDAAMREQLRRHHHEAEPIHNNCSGKHAGMLYYCRKQGLPTETYLSPDHPLQREIARILKTDGGLSDLPVGVDGCGVPTFYMPVVAMARLYSRLVTVEAYRPVLEAMTAHPVLVGGDGRVDTAIMQASGGKLIAKVGAEGLICVGHLDEGLGLALKIVDGSGEARNKSIIQVLAHLNWLDEPAMAHPALCELNNLRRTNTRGEVVGEYRINTDVIEAYG